MNRFYLDENGWLWDKTHNIEAVMTDSEYEQLTNQTFLDNAKGDVLIGGLGIRFINQQLQQMPHITSITIIEKHKEVVDLTPVPEGLPIPETVIHADIFDYVPDKKYDTIYIDLWANHEEGKTQNIEATIDETIERLKAYLKPNGWIGKWQRVNHHA
jgi:spermidine synthase